MAATFKPPATQRVYDACILGGGLGGAAAGALLSRRGFRVLLIDTGPASPLRADGGWLFPSAPLLLPSIRLLPAAESLLAELGLAGDVARALEPLAPDLQLLWPRHRLELSRDAGRLRTELIREWPAEAERLLAALQGVAAAGEAAALLLRAAPPLPPGGFFDRLALGKALRGWAQATGLPREALAGQSPLGPLGAHPLGTALAALVRFLGCLEGAPAPLSLARLAGVSLRGLHRTGPGMVPLEEALRRRLLETRGEALGSAAEPARVESIELEGRRLASVHIAGSPDAYRARAFVLAAPTAWLAGALPAASLAPRAAQSLARSRPGRRLVAHHLILRPAGLPPGLGPAALWLGDGGAADEAVLLLSGPARREPRKGQTETLAEERAVSAFTLAPPQGDAAAAQSRLQSALDELVPFRAGHQIHEVTPAPAPYLLDIDGEAALGVAGLPVRSPLKNLFLASREVVPGLGTEGELYAALQAAAHAAALLGAKDRPR